MNKSFVLAKTFGPLTLPSGTGPISYRFLSAILTDKKVAECYNILKIPIDSKQDVVRKAFLELAKTYHPDSGSPEANIEKFVDIENAFRILTKHNTGKSSKKEVEKIVYDIQHTAPQHRQYLSYEGVGHGTPFQRQKQWQQARAQQAADNVMEHRLAKALATENTLMKKGQSYQKKHDIKTRYGFDRLVEDLIQESISKGEFEKLKGVGKPLKDQNRNPYVDFTTHKINEVLINNGFTPEWIMMNKEINHDIDALKEEIERDRMYLGPHPLSPEDQAKWDRICQANRDLAKSINTKINTFNLIVPLLNKQKFHVDFEKMCEEILVDGKHSVSAKAEVKVIPKEPVSTTDHDILGIFIKGLSELFSFNKPKKNLDN